MPCIFSPLHLLVLVRNIDACFSERSTWLSKKCALQRNIEFTQIAQNCPFFVKKCERCKKGNRGVCQLAQLDSVPFPPLNNISPVWVFAPRRHPGVGRLEGLLICQKTQSPRLRKTFNLLDIAFQLLHKCRPSHSKFHLKDVRQQTNWSDVRAFPSASTKVVGAHQTFQTIQNFNFKH